MLRNVQRQVEVNPFNNTTILDGQKKLTEKKRKQFEKGKEQLEAAYYKKEKLEIESKISKLFD